MQRKNTFNTASKWNAIWFDMVARIGHSAFQYLAQSLWVTLKSDVYDDDDDFTNASRFSPPVISIRRVILSFSSQITRSFRELLIRNRRVIVRD